MATARTLPRKEETENMAATQQPAVPARVYPRTLNPVLVVILIGMFIFPFLVRFLPTPVAQHLEAIFRR